MERSGNNRSGVMPRPCTYVGEDTAEIQCVDIHGVFEMKEYADDIRQACELKI